jgi:hypothetical protein
MPISQGVELLTPEKKEWPIIPEDVYQVQITDIKEDINEYQGEKSEVFVFEFTIIEEGDYYGRKFWKSGKRVSPIPYKTGNNPLTWKVCSAVAKHPLTEEEGKQYTIDMINACIAKQIRLGVKVVEKDNIQRNKADGFYMAKQDLPAFDESKVKKDEAPKPLTPAEIVAKASEGKFTPKQAAIAEAVGLTEQEAQAESVDFGQNAVEDVEF